MMIVATTRRARDSRRGKLSMKALKKDTARQHFAHGGHSICLLISQARQEITMKKKERVRSEHGPFFPSLFGRPSLVTSFLHSGIAGPPKCPLNFSSRRDALRQKSAEMKCKSSTERVGRSRIFLLCCSRQS